MAERKVGPDLVVVAAPAPGPLQSALLLELQPEPRELLTKLGVAPGIIPPERVFAHARDAIQAATAMASSAEDDRRAS